MARYDRLSALDATFLHLERVEYPMHVGALILFEGERFFDASGRMRIREIRDLVASRLPLVPRFRKRLMEVPWHQGRPIWVDDDRFDIVYHVRHTALPRPGTWEQLVALTERIEENLLDRSRPLWQLWFVEGLENGQVALVQKTHHALIDGISGVDVATLLLDLSPEHVPADPDPWRPQPAPVSTQLLVDSVRERLTEPAEMLRSVRRAFRAPRRAARRIGEVSASLATLVNRDLVAPRTSLNAHTGRARRYAVARIPLDEVKQIRRALGGTVNDVVLAGVGGALHRFLEQRGDPVDDLRLRVMVPVSVRDGSERNTLGNKVSAMFVSLPVGPMSPTERLAEISEQTRDLKERRQAVGADFLISLTDYMAPTLMSLASRAAHRQPFFNLIITNVPGPQFPLYLMGARMVEAFPVVPLTQNLTLVVGILSYDGVMHFGLYGDREACPDLDVLQHEVEDSFTELAKAASEVNALAANDQTLTQDGD